jgi:DNA-binding transcriptional LysR family regulator
MERYPQIELELHQVVSHEALLGIRNRDLDASFYSGAQPATDLTCILLREITYQVAVPVGWAHELADKSWEALTARPWVVAPATSSHRQVVLEAFSGRTSFPERMVEADTESVIVNLVESGVGASLVREEIAIASAAEGRIAIYPGADIVTHLWLVYDKARKSDPLMEAVLDVLREVWTLPPALSGSDRERCRHAQHPSDRHL